MRIGVSSTEPTTAYQENDRAEFANGPLYQLEGQVMPSEPERLPLDFGLSPSSLR
jgi:hypothetical protein